MSLGYPTPYFFAQSLERARLSEGVYGQSLVGKGLRGKV
jgi:hypothetical protein